MALSASTAQAAAETTYTIVRGTVTSAAGPVAGAQVWLVAGGDDTELQRTVTAADGTFKLWPAEGTYSFGVEPPKQVAAGYAVRDVVIDHAPGGGNVTIDVALPDSSAPGQLSGSVMFTDGAPAEGSVVRVINWGSGRSIPVVVDATGHWELSSLLAGNYQLEISGGITDKGTRYVTVAPGQHRVLTHVVTSDGSGRLTGQLSTSGLALRRAKVELVDAAGTVLATSYADLTGQFEARAPGGPVTVRVTPQGVEDTGAASYGAQLTAARTASVSFELAPLSVVPGATASNAARDVAFLNAERARWGLPAGIAEIPAWSQACASHDHYQRVNKLLDHPESAGRPGYSPGGNWAGTHSVLSGGGSWTADANPWEDAPYHLAQLFAPNITAIGIDDSAGYACATTWPGMREPIAAPGTVFTYPGDGTTGLPPAERAAERPSVPGDQVGLPAGTLTGRHLFVYQQDAPNGVGCFGSCDASQTAHVTSASLVGPRGPEQLRLLDAGGFSPAAIIIPVKPLLPNAVYTASVSLAGDATEFQAPLEAVTHQWTFATGAMNGDGRWLGTGSIPAARPAASRPTISLRHTAKGLLIVGRGFKPKQRATIIRVLARGGRWTTARLVRADGTFTALLRISTKRAFTMRVVQGSTVARATFKPKGSRHVRRTVRR